MNAKQQYEREQRELEEFLSSVSPLTEEEAVSVYLATSLENPFRMDKDAGPKFRELLDKRFAEAVEAKRCKG